MCLQKIRKRKPDFLLLCQHGAVRPRMLLSLAALGFGIQLQPGRRSFTPPDEPPVVVDLRPRAEFRACHLQGSASVPADELSALLYTLPPPAEWPVTLLGTREQLAEAQALLQPKGWSAKELLVERASELERLGPTTAGDDSAATGPPTWRPNSFLAAVLRSQQLAAPPAGLVVDVGCGSGRDAVYLRQQLQAPTALATSYCQLPLAPQAQPWPEPQPQSYCLRAKPLPRASSRVPELPPPAVARHRRGTWSAWTTTAARWSAGGRWRRAPLRRCASSTC